MRRFFSTAPPPPQASIQELLEKHRKMLSRESLTEIREYLQKHALREVPMWKMGGFMRFFCQFARFQAYAYGIAATGYLLYAFGEKWSRGQETQRKLKIVTPLIVVSSLAALAISLKLTRLLVRDITYYPHLRAFGVRFYTNYFTTRQYLVRPEHICALEVKSRLQAANYRMKVGEKERAVTTQVLGEWYNKRLFYHLLDGKSLEDDPSDSPRTPRGPPKYSTRK